MVNTNSTPLEVEWADPPNLVIDSRFARFAAALMANRNKWAVMARGEKNGNLTTYVREARASCFAPRQSFEAKSHKESDGTITIYARFVGVEL